MFFALSWMLFLIDRLTDATEALAQIVGVPTAKGRTLMATVDELNTKMDAALAKVGELGGQAQEIAQSLRDLIANPPTGGIKPEDLDPIAAKADAIATSAQGGIDATKDVDPTP